MSRIFGILTYLITTESPIMPEGSMTLAPIMMYLTVKINNSLSYIVADTTSDKRMTYR